MSSATVRVTCEAGPAAGRAVLLGPGRHVVGRSRHAAVTLADPAVETHHGVLTVSADGAAAFTQLTGRVPCRIDGDVITIGRSRMRLGERPAVHDLAGALAAAHDTGWAEVGLRASLGWGRPVGLEVSEAADESVEVELTPGSMVTITGRGAPAVARALVLQLAVWAGPEEWELLALTDDAAWQWCATLPHCTAGVAPDELPAHIADAPGRGAVIVTDRPWLLAQEERPLRRLLAARAVAVIAVDVAGGAPDHLVGGHLDVGSVGLARWRRAEAPGDTVIVHPAGVEADVALGAARMLATRPASPTRQLPLPPLPSRVPLGEVFEQHGPCAIDDAVALAGRWRRGDGAPPIVLGLTASGIATVAWATLGGAPVGIIGAPRSGRTDLLRLLVLNLACRSTPSELAITLVGGDLDGCDRLPHIVAAGATVDRALVVVVDEPEGGLDDAAMDAALASLAAPRAQLLVAGPGGSALLTAALANRAGMQIALRLGDEDAVLGAADDVRRPDAMVERPGRAVMRLVDAQPEVFQATWTGRHTGGPDDGRILIRSIRHAATLLPVRANMPGCPDESSP